MKVWNDIETAAEILVFHVWRIILTAYLLTCWKHVLVVLLYNGNKIYMFIKS